MEYTSADRHTIVVDASAEQHMLAHPETWVLLPEVFQRMIIGTDLGHVNREVVMGRVVGTCALVAVAPDTTSLFAIRRGRTTPTHITRTVEADECSTVTVVLERNDTTQPWRFLTAYIGYIAPAEPLAMRDRTAPAFAEALAFWQAHALVYDPTTMGEPYESTWEAELARTQRCV